jgi:hypothetical protein
MWFPPYNLKFTENVNVNWNSNAFIGRGEEIYTYTNTVRSGTLDFTLLIDHPSILNKWRGTAENNNIEDKRKKELDLLRFFAGCGNLNDEVEPYKTPEGKDYELGLNSILKPAINTKKIAYVVFFPNNFTGYDYFNGKEEHLKTHHYIDDVLSEYNTSESKFSKYYEKDKIYKDHILEMKIIKWNLVLFLKIMKIKYEQH